MTLRDLVVLAFDAAGTGDIQATTRHSTELERRIARLETLSRDWSRKIMPHEIAEALEGDF